MRQDARSLLERLGRNEFRYQEFDDPFADMELWPIFEALLRDDNVVGHQASALRNAEIQFRSTAPSEAKPVEASAPFFARYGDADKTVASIHTPAPAPAPPPINLRQFFGRFPEGQ